MVSLNNFELEKIVGKGSYGTVYRAKYKPTDEVFAIKKMSISNIKHYDIKYIINEIKILASHNCPNIVKYYTVFSSLNSVYIVTEYAEQGDLYQLIKKHKTQHTKFKENEVWHYFTQICFAIQYLHKNNILHRDIKSANIFIDKNNNVKLGDFGVVKVMYYHMLYAYTQVGTPYYMSPEIYKCERYTTKSDMWSLGCVLYELMALTQPFVAPSLYELKCKIFSGRYSSYNLGQYSVDLKIILKDLLNIYSYSRISVDDVLKKPSVRKYITSIDQESPIDFKIKTIFHENCVIPRRANDWNIVIKKYSNNNLVSNVPVAPIIKPGIDKPLYSYNSLPKKPSVAPSKLPTPRQRFLKPTSDIETKHCRVPMKLDMPPIPTPPSKPKQTEYIKPIRVATPKDDSIYNKHIMNNTLNKDLSTVNKEIATLNADIDHLKKLLEQKFCQLEFYNKKKQLFHDNNKNKPPLLPNINNNNDNNNDNRNIKTPLTNNQNNNILIKIGSRHEENYFIR